MSDSYVQEVQEREPIHFAEEVDMNTFVVGRPGGRLLDDMGQSFVYGFFTTSERARELEAAMQELDESVHRLGITSDDETKELHAWEIYQDAQSKVFAERREAAGVNSKYDDTIRVTNDWVLGGGLDVDEHGRFISGQVITPEKLVLARARHWPAPTRGRPVY